MSGGDRIPRSFTSGDPAASASIVRATKYDGSRRMSSPDREATKGVMAMALKKFESIPEPQTPTRGIVAMALKKFEQKPSDSQLGVSAAKSSLGQPRGRIKMTRPKSISVQSGVSVQDPKRLSLRQRKTPPSDQIQRSRSAEPSVYAESDSEEDSDHSEDAEDYRLDPAHRPSAQIQQKRENQLIRQLERAVDDHGEQSVQVMHILQEQAQMYWETRNLESARDCLKRMIGVQEKVLGPSHKDVAMSMTQLGHVFHDLGYNEQARGQFDKALLIQQRVDARHPQVMKILIGLARCHSSPDQLSKRRELLEKAIDLADTVDEKQLLELYELLGETYEALQRFDKQRDVCLRELDIRRSLFGNSDESLVSVLRSLARAYRHLRELHPEKDALRHALEIQERLPRKRTQATMMRTLCMLADVHGELGELESSAKCLERVLELKLEVYGEQSPTSLVTLWELAGVRDQLGDDVALESVLRQALDMTVKLYGESDERVAFVLAHLGLAEARLGIGHNIKEYSRRALRILETVYPDPVPVQAEVLKHFARASVLLGKSSTAKRVFKRAITMEQKLLPTYHPQFIGTLLAYSKYLGSIGQYEVQQDMLEDATVALAKAEDLIERNESLTSTDLHESVDSERSSILSLFEQAQMDLKDTLSSALIQLGLCQRRLGESEKERQTMQVLVSKDEARYGDDSVLVAMDRLLLGQAQYRCRKLDLAMETLKASFLRLQQHLGSSHELTRQAEKYIDLIEKEIENDD